MKPIQHRFIACQAVLQVPERSFAQGMFNAFPNAISQNRAVEHDIAHVFADQLASIPIAPHEHAGHRLIVFAIEQACHEQICRCFVAMAKTSAKCTPIKIEMSKVCTTFVEARAIDVLAPE